MARRGATAKSRKAKKNLKTSSKRSARSSALGDGRADTAEPTGRVTGDEQRQRSQLAKAADAAPEHGSPVAATIPDEGRASHMASEVASPKAQRPTDPFNDQPISQVIAQMAQMRKFITSAFVLSGTLIALFGAYITQQGLENPAESASQLDVGEWMSISTTSMGVMLVALGVALASVGAFKKMKVTAGNVSVILSIGFFVFVLGADLLRHGESPAKSQVGAVVTLNDVSVTDMSLDASPALSCINSGNKNVPTVLLANGLDRQTWGWPSLELGDQLTANICQFAVPNHWGDHDVKRLQSAIQAVRKDGSDLYLVGYGPSTTLVVEAVNTLPDSNATPEFLGGISLVLVAPALEVQDKTIPLTLRVTEGWKEHWDRGIVAKDGQPGWASIIDQTAFILAENESVFSNEGLTAETQRRLKERLISVDDADHFSLRKSRVIGETVIRMIMDNSDHPGHG